MIETSNFRRLDLMPGPQTRFNNCHASNIVRIGPGEFLCAFMAGEREAAPDMSIWLARHAGGAWREPEKIKSIHGLAHWNPVLGFDGSRVWLVYQVGPSVPEWSGMVSHSDDSGRIWSQSVPAVAGDQTPRISVRNKVLRTSGGTLLGPCSVEGEEFWDSFVDMSRDGGVTWDKRPIPFEHERSRTREGGDWGGLAEGALWENDLSTVLKWDGVIQPALWESAPGSVHAFMRSTRGRVFRSDSPDGGATWGTAYPTEIPNNNSGVDVVRTNGGELALAYNPVAGNWTLRSPLSVAFSVDNGATFGNRIDLETEDGEFSYPSIIADDGAIHVTYTHNRKTIIHCAFDIRRA